MGENISYFPVRKTALFLVWEGKLERKKETQYPVGKVWRIQPKKNEMRGRIYIMVVEKGVDIEDLFME